MKLSELKPADGARKDKTRVGRGTGSGCGKTSGRGRQMPIYRRLPKRGFKNIWRKEYAEVNVSTLNVFDDDMTVDAVALVEAGILKNVLDGVRILGDGELTKKLTVKAQGFTKTAVQKIEAAGGKTEVI